MTKYPYITREYFDYIDEKVNIAKGKDPKEETIEDNLIGKQLDAKPIQHSNAGQMRKAFKKGGKLYQSAGLFQNPFTKNMVELTGPNGEKVTATKGTEVYNSYISQGYTETPNITPSTTTPSNDPILNLANIGKQSTPINPGIVGMTGQPISTENTNLSTENNNLAAENENLATEGEGLALENTNLQDGDYGINYSRVNSGTNFIRTVLDNLAARRNRVGLKPISSIYVPDVAPQLMKDRSSAMQQVQSQFARNVQGANRFASPEYGQLAGMNMLDQQAKFALDQQASEIQEKYRNEAEQFAQQQGRNEAQTRRDADIQQQQQKIDLNSAQTKAAMERDLMQAGLDYVVGAGDANDQAVRMNTYNQCLNKESEQDKQVVQQYKDLAKKVSAATGDEQKKLQAELDNMKASYTTVNDKIQQCFNQNIGLAMSQQAGLGSFGVKKDTFTPKKNGGIFSKFAKGGKNNALEVYKANVKKTIEKEKNQTKKDIATIKALQDYYKIINKAASDQNKELTKALNNIIKR